MTPTTRDELVELMVKAVWPSGQYRVAHEARCADIRTALDAMAAAGVGAVPLEATEEMIDHACAKTGCPREFWEHRRKEINAAIAAGNLLGKEK